uniref:Uncharacterized protein n=1 Tax=Arundo donax TaxID=35708 RepID=A0A0A9F4V0_ARUDO
MKYILFLQICTSENQVSTSCETLELFAGQKANLISTSNYMINGFKKSSARSPWNTRVFDRQTRNAMELWLVQ